MAIINLKIYKLGFWIIKNKPFNLSRAKDRRFMARLINLAVFVNIEKGEIHAKNFKKNSNKIFNKNIFLRRALLK